MPSSKRQAWSIDQLTKSVFFHQKLHEWGMLEVADAIDAVKGEQLQWDLEKLNISQSAWDKVIHRGIKPIVVFAHPQILMTVARAVGYYRMLAMVSQKSMGQIGLSITKYEQDGVVPKDGVAEAIAQRLNSIISNLIEDDETIDAREFMLWRGMAAGSQAQGSWQNTKGNRAEIVIKAMLQRRFREKRLLLETTEAAAENDDERYSRTILGDGRLVVFGDEPDIAIFRDAQIIVAVEVKGGIDKAGVLERVGAAIKSLNRAKEENPGSVTILLMQGVSVTQQAINDLKTNQAVVNHWFTVEEILDEEERRELFFSLLGI